jgi:hypothetical protein
MLTRHVCRKRCFQRSPEQWLARGLLRGSVDLTRRHRLPDSLEHQRHGLEHRAYLGGNRPRFARIDRGPTEQFVVERA